MSLGKKSMAKGRLPAPSPNVKATKVSAPVAKASVQRSQNPAEFRISRREFVEDISGSVGFSNNSFSFNPGLGNLFPWASSIANSYEQYVVQDVSFCYEPSSSTSATGAVMLAFDYDPLDAAPVNKSSALQCSDYVRTPPWAAAKLVLRKADLSKRQATALYTRAGGIVGADLKTYDLGRLNVSCEGQAGVSAVGELWIEYTIVLRIPQQSPSNGTLLYCSSCYVTGIFNGPQVITGNNSLVVASGKDLVFERGYYMVTIKVDGTGIPVDCQTVTYSAGCIVNDLGSNTISSALQSTSLTLCYVPPGGKLTFFYSGTSVNSSTTFIAPWFAASL
jgi:hypothetical protein